MRRNKKNHSSENPGVESGLQAADKPADIKNADTPLPQEAAPRKSHTWFIDPGHGPRTHGKHSPTFAEDTATVAFGDRFKEWEFNQNTAIILLSMCLSKGIDARITLPAERRGDDLEARVNMANNSVSDLPKIFISIHANAGPSMTENHWQLAHGTETFYYNASKLGKALAEIFQRKMLAEFGFLDRGVKPNATFRVLRKTSMPAILTEVGFFNHRGEVKVLASAAGAQRYAESLFAGIREVEGF